MDQTASLMGARLLKRWMVKPLKDEKAIARRLEIVDHLYRDPDLREGMVREIQQIGDLERLISKIGLQKANPREVVQLKRALHAIEQLKTRIGNVSVQALKHIAEQLDSCTSIRERIEAQLHSEPPVAVNKGNVIADGVDDELDKLRKIAFGGKDYLLAIQRRE